MDGLDCVLKADSWGVVSDEVYCCKHFEGECGFKSGDQSDGFFEAVLLRLVERSYIFAYFIDAVILHCEWFKCSRAHLFKAFDVAAVKVIYKIINLQG